jgi:hypothetical protein
MYPATMQTISAEQGREMRERAAAWRRARVARQCRTRTARQHPVRAHRALRAVPAWAGCVVRVNLAYEAASSG